jgi:hypothetical protein
MDLLALLYNYNQLQQLTRTFPYWTTGVFSSTVTNDEQRITATESLNSLTNQLINQLSLSLMLRLTVSRLVCLGIKHPSEAYDQIFINV